MLSDMKGMDLTQDDNVLGFTNGEYESTQFKKS